MVRFDIVVADAEESGAGFLEARPYLLKGGQLGRSAGSVVLRVKSDDCWAERDLLGKRDVASRARQSEVWGFATYC